MQLDNAQSVESLIWSMRQADIERALDRTRINELFNGTPPYSDSEVRDNGISVNVNWLESTRLAHDARSQFAGAFLKPGKYFTARTDMGTRSKRQERSAIVTREINRIMKGSQPYFETFRSKFAMDILHGIAPVVWDNESAWCPQAVGIGDVLIPGRTLLTMQNLPLTGIYHSYTVPELMKLTRGPKVDPGWNLEQVDQLLKYIDKETANLMNSNWPEIWSPEKSEERIKGDGGWYAADSVPTIDVWDVYIWDDDGKKSGWERRMILDSWSTPQYPSKVLQRSNKYDFAKGQWLYNSGRRKVCDTINNIVCWQFADLSAVSPFQYHSVRALGFLLYAVCHLQNRLRCKFNEAVFENLMMLLRVKTLDEVERALKVNLFNRGFLDESVTIVPAAERHTINTALVQLGLTENSRLINENSQSYRSNFNTEDDRTRRTKFEVMAELNATTALVQAALAQAYEYQKFEYREIVRRFFRQYSRDVEVNKFRAACLRQRVPEKMLVAEAWDIEPERVMGAGNKALELQIAQQLMQFRQLYDPDPQRKILRDVTLAITDDPARAMDLVPETRNPVTDSVHDAQLAAGTLMQGLPVALRTGYNHGEYVQTLLQAMAMICQKIQQRGAVATPDELLGLQNMQKHITQHMAILAQDKIQKPMVKKYGDALGKLMNLVKGFAQRLQEQQQKAAQNGQGMDPKEMAKVKAQMMLAEAKAKNTRESHAQRTAQRQLQWQVEEKRAAAEHERKMREAEQEAQLDMKIKAAEAGLRLKEKNTAAAHGMVVNRLNAMRSTETDE